MSTLFERVISNSSDNADKIPIHMVQSLMAELNAGRLTIQQTSDIMGLDAQQTAEFTSVLSSALASSDKSVFAQRVFAYLVLAESSHRAKNNGLDSYRVEANFWNMIAQEALN